MSRVMCPWCTWITTRDNGVLLDIVGGQVIWVCKRCVETMTGIATREDEEDW